MGETKETKPELDIKAALADLKSQFDSLIEERTKAIEKKADDEIKKSEEAIKTIQAEAAEMQKQLDEITIRQKDQKVDKKIKSVPEQIEETLEKNKDKFKAFAENKSSFRLEKAATIISTSNFGAGVVQGFREAGINEAPMRRRFILSLINTMNGGPGSNPLTWIEWRPKDGGPATVAESDPKPLMDWTYVEGTANAKFISVLSYVTKQALLNMPVLAQEINNELLMNLADELDYQILFGDNTGDNLKGINEYAQAFTGSGLAGNVDKANIFDVIRAAVLQVRKGNKAASGYTRRTGYLPNYVLVSPDSAAKLDLTKDANGQYILPPFTSQDGQIIKGVRVVENDFIDADDFIVGDFTKSLFNFVEGITLETGLINDQFAKNQMTIRAEVYGMHRIKYHDSWAFVKGDFTSGIALIDKVTT